MKFRTLGRTGYQVSEIGLGCWQLGGDFGPVDDARSTAILDEAHRQGISFWDTADVYGDGLSERRIGQWRKEHPGDAQSPPLVVATKVGRNQELYPDGYTRDTVRASLTRSLERLGGESIDLAQLHCVPFELLKAGEILGWMQEFQREGLIRHFGASVETIEEALFCLHQPGIVSLQIIFNLFRQDAVTKLLDKAQAAGVGIIVRLPLASGLLGGKMSTATKFTEQDHRNYNRDGQRFNVGETFSGLPFEKGLALVDELRDIAGTEVPLSQFSLRWILDHPAVSSIIAGVTRPEQVVDNAAASDLPPLDQALHGRLAEFYRTEVRPHVRGAI